MAVAEFTHSHRPNRVTVALNTHYVVWIYCVTRKQMFKGAVIDYTLFKHSLCGMDILCKAMWYGYIVKPLNNV